MTNPSASTVCPTEERETSGNSTRAEFYAGRTVTKGSNGWSAQIEVSRDEFEDQTEESE